MFSWILMRILLLSSAQWPWAQLWERVRAWMGPPAWELGTWLTEGRVLA